MRHACPHPYCCSGVVPIVDLRRRRVVGRRRCPVCRGDGWVQEEDADLFTAGVVLRDRSDEDFRSSPMHWRG